MRLYVSADMEGTAAACSWTQVDPANTTEYPYYRRLMSQEIARVKRRSRSRSSRRSRSSSVSWMHNADFVHMMPGFERIGSRSVRFVHDDYRVVFKAYVAALRLGAAANAPV